MAHSSLMVIDPSLSHPEIASFNKIANQCSKSCTYHLPAISDLDSMIRGLSKSCGIIILGSASSVNDRTEWQTALREVIDNSLNNDIPLLGLCFGHQFLAYHFGGKIDYLWKKEIKKGIRNINMRVNNLIDKESKYGLIYSHQEGIVNCPNDFRIIAESKMVKIEGIEHKSKAIWGFQPHIEASWSFAKRQGISHQAYQKLEKSGIQIMQAFLDTI